MERFFPLLVGATIGAALAVVSRAAGIYHVVWGQMPLVEVLFVSAIAGAMISLIVTHFRK